MRGAYVIAKNQMRLVSQDAQLIVFVIVMPIVLTLFLQPAFKLILHSEGFRGANGAEQAIPGAAALFGFNVGIFLTIAIYRDHGWGIWDRLRTTDADAVWIVIGMAGPYYVVGVGAMLVDFVLGDLLFGLRLAPVAGPIALLSVAYMLCVIGLGLLLATVTRTLQQVTALGQPIAVLLAIAGGAFMPLSVLPKWAHHVAPSSPTYWAMRGFRAALLAHQGISSALLPAAALVGFAAACIVATSLRLRPSQPKTGWA
jgi:ABC-2 type transport system permease protein